MKRLITLAVIVLISPFTLAAQTGESIPVDPVTQCAYRYYYYPNLEAYFDSKKEVYLIRQKTGWVEAEEIPSGFRGYSLFNNSNVVIDDYDDDNVVQFLAEHKKRYPVRFNARVREVASAPRRIP